MAGRLDGLPAPVAARLHAWSDASRVPSAPPGLRAAVLAAFDAAGSPAARPLPRRPDVMAPPGSTPWRWQVLLGGVSAAAAAAVVALGLALRAPDRADPSPGAASAWETLHPVAARQPLPRLRVVDVRDDAASPDWTSAPVVTAAYRSFGSLRGAGADGQPIDGP